MVNVPRGWAMSRNNGPSLSPIWIAIAACWVLGLLTLLAQCGA